MASFLYFAFLVYQALKIKGLKPKAAASVASLGRPEEIGEHKDEAVVVAKLAKASHLLQNSSTVLFSLFAYLRAAFLYSGLRSIICCCCRLWCRGGGDKQPGGGAAR